MKTVEQRPFVTHFAITAFQVQSMTDDELRELFLWSMRAGAEKMVADFVKEIRELVVDSPQSHYDFNHEVRPSKK